MSETVDATCSRDGCKHDGIYYLTAACMNCDWRGQVQLSRGHEFDRFTVHCPRCDCRTLMKSRPHVGWAASVTGPAHEVKGTAGLLAAPFPSVGGGRS